MAQPDRPPDHPPPKARSGGLVGRLQEFLAPGPWRWMFKQEPAPPRFHAGQHLHGLEEHDLAEREAAPLPRDGESQAPLDDRLLR